MTAAAAEVGAAGAGRGAVDLRRVRGGAERRGAGGGSTLRGRGRARRSPERGGGRRASRPPVLAAGARFGGAGAGRETKARPGHPLPHLCGAG